MDEESANACFLCCQTSCEMICQTWEHEHEWLQLRRLGDEMEWICACGETKVEAIPKPPRPAPDLGSGERRIELEP